MVPRIGPLLRAMGPKDIFDCELIEGAVPASSPKFAD